MRFEEPLGHARQLAGLLRAAREGRLAHALCFSGPSGIGKFLAAEWLTFGLLCAHGPGAPCGACGPCKRLKSDGHPDVFVLDPLALELESIQLGHIAARSAVEGPNVVDFLSLRPMEGGWRVVLIREAERATTEAQNALLKTLEEPGTNTLLVLETAQPGALLATINSRCIRVGFSAPGRAATIDVLRAHSVDEPRASALARWSGGAPGRALALHALRADLLRALLERVLQGELTAFAALRELDAIEGEFAGQTKSAVARARARSLLDLALEVLVDLQRAAVGVDPELLAHGDLVLRLPPPGRAALSSQLEHCLAARQDVEVNLAPDALCERALLALEPRSARAVPVREPR